MTDNKKFRLKLAIMLLCYVFLMRIIFFYNVWTVVAAAWVGVAVPLMPFLVLPVIATMNSYVDALLKQNKIDDAFREKV